MVRGTAGLERQAILSSSGVRLGDRTRAAGASPGKCADSAGHAAGGHRSGPTMNPRGGGAGIRAWMCDHLDRDRIFVAVQPGLELEIERYFGGQLGAVFEG